MQRLFVCLLFLFAATPAWSDCTGGMFGASSYGIIISTLDVSSSPTYSSATTSGTMGCRNWEFVDALQRHQMEFLADNQDNLAEESAQGSGPHLDALAQLLGCHPKAHATFSQGMRDNEALLIKTRLKDSHDVTEQQLMAIKQWIQSDPLLRQECSNVRA